MCPYSPLVIGVCIPLLLFNTLFALILILLSFLHESTYREDIRLTFALLLLSYILEIPYTSKSSLSLSLTTLTLFSSHSIGLFQPLPN